LYPEGKDYVMDYGKDIESSKHLLGIADIILRSIFVQVFMVPAKA